MNFAFYFAAMVLVGAVDVYAQYSPRQPAANDLQNQVNALSAHIAAANRQLQYLQQQISLTSQPQPQVQLARPAPQQQLDPQQQQHQQQHQQALQLQQQIQRQLQLQAAQPQLQAQQLTPQQLGLDPQQYLSQVQPHQVGPANPQPAQVSTLVDNESAQQQFSGQQPNLHFQPSGQHQVNSRLTHQQSFQASVEGTSTSATPTSIEPSAPVTAPLNQQEVPMQQAPPATMQAPHSPPKNDDKFSIGLGVLSPGYTQKFGNTALDFNQDKNGFSFTLSNNGHNNQQPQAQQRQPSQ